MAGINLTQLTFWARLVSIRRLPGTFTCISSCIKPILNRLRLLSSVELATHVLCSRAMRFNNSWHDESADQLKCGVRIRVQRPGRWRACKRCCRQYSVKYLLTRTLATYVRSIQVAKLCINNNCMLPSSRVRAQRAGRGGIWAYCISIGWFYIALGPTKGSRW